MPGRRRKKKRRESRGARNTVTRECLFIRREKTGHRSTKRERDRERDKEEKERSERSWWGD